MLIGPELASLIKDSLHHWKHGEVSDMAYRFREDAALSSVFLSDTGTIWVQGRDDVLAHLSTVRARFSNFDVVDVSTDTVLYVIILKADEQLLTVVVEPEVPSLLIRKMIICRSIWQSLLGGKID